MSGAQAARIAALEARTDQLSRRVEALSYALCLAGEAGGHPEIAEPIIEAAVDELAGRTTPAGWRVLPGGASPSGRPPRLRRGRTRPPWVRLVRHPETGDAS